MHQLTYGDIKAAADRIAGRIRPVTLAPQIDILQMHHAHSDARLFVS